MLPEHQLKFRLFSRVIINVAQERDVKRFVLPSYVGAALTQLNHTLNKRADTRPRDSLSRTLKLTLSLSRTLIMKVFMLIHRLTKSLSHLFDIGRIHIRHEALRFSLIFQLQVKVQGSLRFCRV